MVAGESSGDRLGADLIQALRARVPRLQVEGVAGPRMTEAGCRVLERSERLAVMGIFEVATHLPGLLALRRRLHRHFVAHPPDVFVGIDAPDFNLALETGLRRAGVRTVHYVGPTAWAWREGRAGTVRRAADRLLTLFPFEEHWYRQRGVPALFVGHPLADAIPSSTDRRGARAALDLVPDAPTLALLPGSRAGELSRHLAPFLAAALWCAERVPGLQCAIPVIDGAAEVRVREALARAGTGLRATVHRERAREVIGAADAVLLASGTAAVETMLVKRPMAVAYRLSWPSFLVVRALIRVPWCSMVNVLAGRTLVPEFVQGAMHPAHMGAALLPYLLDPGSDAALQADFAELHRQLRRPPGASANAAAAIMELLGR